jgi:hypothetical protein
MSRELVALNAGWRHCAERQRTMVHADPAINLLNGMAGGFTVALNKDGYEGVAVKGTSGFVDQVHFSIESLRRR